MACRVLLGGLAVGGLSLSRAGDVELVNAGGHSTVKHCPVGARCKDASYEASAYPCSAESSLRPGEANIIEFRCSDGKCTKTRGLCNGKRNCEDGSDEEGCDGVLNTTSAAALSSPFDCFADYQEWKTAWTQGQKEWCCNEYHRGCGEEERFDCEEDPSADGEVDEERKQWCCQHRGRWCGREHAGFDCKDWTSRWNSDKKSYCCKVERRGCTLLTPPEYQPAYECASSDDWVTKWTQAEKDWCCAARGVNCPDSLHWALANHKLYDCKVDDEWPKAKKAWCCKNEKIACTKDRDQVDGSSDDAEAPDAIADDEQVVVTDKPSAESDDSGTMTTMDCTERDTTYDPLDMDGHPMKIVEDVTACQERCAAIEDCAHYSFWKTERHCHVHGTTAVPHSQPDFLSGPPTCDKDGRRYHLLATAALRQRVCFQNEVAFIPYDSVIHNFSPEHMPSPVECQALCNKTAWCSHFTYTVLDSMCHLTDESASVERNVLKSMAGPSRCQDLLTFSLSIESVGFGPVHKNLNLHKELKQGLERVVTEAAGSYDEHYAQLMSPRGNERRLEAIGDQAYPLIPQGYQEVVFSEGDAGELVVTMLVGLPEDIPGRVVRDILTKHLSEIEVGVAKFIAKADGRHKMSTGIIHVRMLRPPSLVPYTNGKDADDVASKFLLNGKVPALATDSSPLMLMIFAAAVSAFAMLSGFKLARSATMLSETEQRALSTHVPNHGYSCLGGMSASSEEEVA
eukprot:CAMPEP_0170248342 /NCGR_PEP_ID=MMETSP0116_2-20130129/23965_1 /TAXON_ID=400756 /ORGANISM="Durinskia baltica, Strain CSIRO CS-38" /LENGTH=738 /DNA_ID=CAMNT_0010499233 /DNA_START=51 /DNA_END=2267 /DNA_ORIENTATION=-